MNEHSTIRAVDHQRHRRAGLRPFAQLLRGKGRAYVGRALGANRVPAALIRHRLGLPPRASWVREGLRLLVFLAAGLLFGALFLLSEP